MLVTPPSDRTEFAGFPAYYGEEIAPYLREKEGERRAAVTNFAILVGSVGFFAGALLLFGPFGEANIHAGAVVGMLGFAGGTWLLNRTRNDITHGLLERICGKLGFFLSV